MLHKFWTSFFGDFEKDGKRRFNEYYAEVRSLVPKEKLLEYKVGSGWEPLCEFLGDEVPKTAFPRTNDTDAFVDRCRKRNHAQMMNVAFRALVVGGSLVATALSASLAYRQFAPGMLENAIQIAVK